MEELEQLEFLFENVIQVSETRNAFVQFLEREKHSNLLYFYETVTEFSRRLQKEVNGLKSTNTPTGTDASNSSTPNSLNESSHANGSPATRANSFIQLGSLSSKHTTSLASFDMFYEVQMILQDYLEPSGKRFINQFETLRTKLIAAIQERIAKPSPDESLITDELEDAMFFASAFKDFTNSVYSSLKCDIFPRFIRSDFLFDVIKTHSSEQSRFALLNKIARKRGSSDLHKILYTEKEYNEDYIREKDFMFSFQLIHDNSSFWTPIFHVDESDESRSSAYFASHGFLSDVKESEAVLVKYMGYLPFAAEDCIKMAQNGAYNSDSDPAIISNTFLDIFLPNREEESKKDFLDRQVACTINYCLLSFGPLLTKRDVVSCCSVKHFPHLDEYILVAKPTVHDAFPEKKKPIRAKFLSALSFQKIASNETRFTFLQYAQMGGWLKKLDKAVIRMAKQRTRAYIQSFTRLTQKAMQENKSLEDFVKEPIEKTYGFAHICQWNEENIQKEELKKHFKNFDNKNLFDFKAKKAEPRVVTVRL